MYKNGEYYTGQVSKNGTRNGHGIYYYSNQDVYDGQFVDNIRIGKSRLRFNDGSEYIGQFMDDQADGHGIYTDIKGNRYMSLSGENETGEFRNNGNFLRGRLYGLGELNFKNGDYYKGLFKGTKRDGYGEMRYYTPDHNMDIAQLGEYLGYWKQDKREGQGKMQYLNN